MSVFAIATDKTGYQSWKRLGDVISSMYALGYHDQARTRHRCSKSLYQIREAAFAFTYSADKNLSIFLGRPPRMLRQHCNFDFLDDIQDGHRSNGVAVSEHLGWGVDEPFTYMTEAWWSMVCAAHKEDVLDLFRERKRDRRVHLARYVGF